MPAPILFKGVLFYENRERFTYFVLTSNHCVKDDNEHIMSPKRMFVRLGVHNRIIPNLQTIQQHAIFKIHQITDLQQTNNDIALLELSTEAVFNEYVQPACINREEDVTGQSGIAVGWGLTEDDELSSTLKVAEMPVVSTNDCLEYDRNTFGQHLGTRYFCAGHTNGTTVCNGDSGGGFHVKRGDRWYIAGIVSFTAPRDAFSQLCKTDSYVAFINVAAFVPWIRNVTALLSLAEKGKITVQEGQDPDPARQYPNYLPRICGNFLVSRIIGGIRANLFEFPWMALLAYRLELSNEVRYGCEGSLINKRYVLTAAHCVYPDTLFQVRLGEYDLSRYKDCNQNDASNCAPPVQDFDIEYVVRHQQSIKRKTDIALVRLVRGVTFNDHIHPICLPVTPNLREQKLQRFIITGFGQTALDSGLSNVLMKANVLAVSRTDCQEIIGDIVTLNEEHICAGTVEDGSNACIGDSGGPLGYPVRYNGVRFVQFGVMSFARTYEGEPWVYINVANQMDWILANMQA